MIGDSSPTRRRFLLATGTTAALAGCSEASFRDESPQRIPLHELPDVSERENSQPVVANDIPVDIERGWLTQTATRVTGLLDSLPMPLGPEDVPNGYLRQELTQAAEAATGHLNEARSANTRLSALESLHHARTKARYAREGWAFVEQGRTKADLRTERREIVAEAEAFRSRYEYFGEDPVRAVVVHAYLRQNLQSVLDARDPDTGGESGQLLPVAKWGEHAESARTYLDDSRYLYDRFRSFIPSNVGTVESLLDAAAESLTAELRRRRDELPPESAESSDEFAGRIQLRFRRHADSSAQNVPASGPARTVLAATEGLTDCLAYDRVRNQIEDGERFGVETGADVRTVRSEAIEAIQTALEESPRPELARGILADAATLVTYADDELARYRNSVRSTRLDDSIRRYITATMRARSVPTACQQVLEELPS